MRSLRNLIHARPLLALLLVAMAVCVRALVPSGYMVSAGSKTITVGLCSGIADAATTQTITIPMQSGGDKMPAHRGKAEMPCAFASLAMGAMAGADAPLLAIALLFVLALGFLPLLPAAQPHNFHLRPPLRGPPAAV
ncbi:hypothetical protein [Sphingorhabdus sp.]|uniref:hypothetical protein n=1 Tax=Sphingorhabdus sp. TaxID=1902408 RepID=UPI0035947892